MRNTKAYYVIYNLAKGLLWLGVFIAAYLLFKKYVNVDYLAWLKPMFNNEPLIILIFLVSEIIVGIIPPEIFIIWALRDDQLYNFIFRVSLLAIISYCAGIIGYFIGHYLNRSKFFRWTKRRFLTKLDSRLQSFGMYLILIAAMTPLPFSGVAMLIGSVRYPFKRFVLFALSRFARFALYAVIFWQIDPNI
jgi:membrane protein YqaA with SNARE-associated domain